MGPLLIGIRSCLQRCLQRESLITRIITSPKSHVLSDIQCSFTECHRKTPLVSRIIERYCVGKKRVYSGGGRDSGGTEEGGRMRGGQGERGDLCWVHSTCCHVRVREGIKEEGEGRVWLSNRRMNEAKDVEGKRGDHLENLGN